MRLLASLIVVFHLLLLFLENGRVLAFHSLCDVLLSAIQLLPGFVDFIFCDGFTVLNERSELVNLIVFRSEFALPYVLLLEHLYLLICFELLYLVIGPVSLNLGCIQVCLHLLHHLEQSFDLIEMVLGLGSIGELLIREE